MIHGTTYGLWLAYIPTGVYNPFGYGDMQGTFIAELNWSGTNIATNIPPSDYGTGTVVLTQAGSRIVRRYATHYGPTDLEKDMSVTDPLEPISYWESVYKGSFIGSIGTWLTGVAIWPDFNGTLWGSNAWWTFDQRVYSCGTIHLELKFFWWDPIISDMQGTRFNANLYRTLAETLRTTYTHHILYGIDDSITFHGQNPNNAYIGTFISQSVAGTTATVIFGLEDDPTFEIEFIKFPVGTIVNNVISDTSIFTVRKWVDSLEGDWPNKSGWRGTVLLEMREWPQYVKGTIGTIYATQADRRQE